MMKKLFVMLSAAILSFAACQDEIAPVMDNADTPEVKDYPVEMTFTAVSEIGTKTTLNGTSVSWEANDRIKVLWGDNKSNVAETSEGGATAAFSTRVDEGVSEFWAAYPYAESTALSEGNLVVEIPAEQGGKFADANYAVAKTTESVFHFKHLVGLVEVSTSLENASKITIKGAENDVLAGTITVSGFNEETGLPVYTVTDGAKEVVLAVNGAGTYYAALIPTADLKCLSVSVETTDGETATTEYALSATNLKMARAQIVYLGNVDSRLGKNYFVTPKGTEVGDGKTWETAMSYQQMAYAMAVNRTAGQPDGGNEGSGSSVKNEEHALQMHGTSWHLMEGEYAANYYVRVSFPEHGSRVKMNVIGGYSKDSKGTDLSMRTGGTTTINKGIKQSQRQFYVKDWTEMTFDGITFTGGVGDDTYGAGAIYYLPTSGTDALLTLKNCAITNSTSQSKGAGILQEGGVLVLDGCTISNCSAATTGGAIHVQNGTLTIKNNTVVSNCSSKSHGAVIYANKSIISILNSSLTSNKATADGSAGALYCMASPGVNTIDGVTIDGCTSKSNGGAIYFGNPSGTLIMRNSVIRNCTTTGYGGGLYITSAGVVVDIENTLFEGNYGATRGGAICQGSNSSACKINGCIFVGNYADKWGGALATSTSGKASYYINNSIFRENYCKNNPNGTALFVRGGYAGVNNCSFYDNHKTSSPLDYSSDIRFIIDQSNGVGGIVLNTTIIHNANSTGSCCISDANTDSVTGAGYTAHENSKVVLMNNLLASANTPVSNFATNGANYYELMNNHSDSTPGSFTKVGDNPWFAKAGLTAQVKVSDIKEMLQSETLFSNLTNNKTFGKDFLTWLNGLTVKAGEGTAVGALDYDIAGNARGTGAYVPGCYQGTVEN